MFLKVKILCIFLFLGRSLSSGIFYLPTEAISDQSLRFPPSGANRSLPAQSSEEAGAKLFRPLWQPTGRFPGRFVHTKHTEAARTCPWVKVLWRGLLWWLTVEPTSLISSGLAGFFLL